MNVFELSFVASPLAGAVAGGASVRLPGIVPVTEGTILGLLIGLVFFFVATAFSGLMMRVPGVSSKEKLNPIQWMASFAGVLVFLAAPFASFVLAGFVSSTLFSG